MLNAEMLIYKNPKFHKDCQWMHAKIRYPDERYLPLKQRLTSEVKKTHIAYRITHWKFGILTTIKFGHDNKVYVADNQGALRGFALY